MKDVQQGQQMSLVAAPLRLPDVIHNHIPYRFDSVFLAHKVAREGTCGNFGQVLVLGYGKDFVFGQTAKPDAVLQRNHRLNVLSRLASHSN